MKTANLGLRLLLEAACVASVTWWGLSLEGPDSLRYFAAFTAAVIVILTWTTFGSPKAPLRLQGGSLFLLEAALFTLAAASLFFGGKPAAALLLVLAAVGSGALHHL